MLGHPFGSRLPSCLAPLPARAASAILWVPLAPYHPNRSASITAFYRGAHTRLREFHAVRPCVASEPACLALSARKQNGAHVDWGSLGRGAASATGCRLQCSHPEPRRLSPFPGGR